MYTVKNSRIEKNGMPFLSMYVLIHFPSPTDERLDGESWIAMRDRTQEARELNDHAIQEELERIADALNKANGGLK